MARRRTLLTVAVLSGLLTACSGSTPAGDATATTAPPSTAQTTQEVAAGPFADGEPVDVVVLTDSGGWGVSHRYAVLASEALDRGVRVQDHRGGAAPEILAGIQGSWAEDVASAEIIVFYVNPGGYGPASHLTCLDALDAVGGDPDYSGPPWIPGQTWAPPAVTTPADWQGYRDVLDQIYDEIWRLRAGQPTILRAYGVWMPWLAQWRQVGIASACIANEEAIDQVRREAAESAGAVYVSMLDVFNGPDHDRDPVTRGLIDDDGMHLSAAGQDVLVEALADAGFELSEPAP